jgi:hypothetical protein
MTTQSSQTQKGKPTMSEESCSGSALAEVAGPLKDLAEKLGGKEGPIWLSALKKFLRKENPWPSFSVWKTIKVGMFRHGRDLCTFLKQKGFNLTLWTPGFLNKIEMASAETEIDLVILSVADMGFSGADLASIYRRIEELDLESCSFEVAPCLRDQYREQLEGESLLVLSPLILDEMGATQLFSVYRDRLGLSLGTEYSSLKAVYRPNQRFVAVKPRK